MKKFFFSVMVLLLVGCSKQYFGVDEEQWNRLSEEQKQEVIRGYNEREKIAEKNRPITNAIDTIGTISQSKIESKHSKF